MNITPITPPAANETITPEAFNTARIAIAPTPENYDNLKGDPVFIPWDVRHLINFEALALPLDAYQASGRTMCGVEFIRAKVFRRLFPDVTITWRHGQYQADWSPFQPIFDASGQWNAEQKAAYQAGEKAAWNTDATTAADALAAEPTAHHVGQYTDGWTAATKEQEEEAVSAKAFYESFEDR